MLGLSSSLVKGGASLLTFVKDNLKLYLDFKSSKSDTLKFPSEGSTEFDGSNDYIDFGDISLTGEFTLACWINRDDTDSAVVWGDSSNADWFRLTSATTADIKIAGNTKNLWTHGATFSSNEWEHLAVVRDSSDQITIYRNGIHYTSNAPTRSGTFVPEYLGQKDSGGYFDGKMANNAIWSRALTTEEIQSIMNKSYSQLKGVEKTSLVSWWALDSQSNGVVQPATGEVLGEELLGDGQFSEDVSQGSSNDNWNVITSGTANHEISNGRYRYTDSGTSTLRAKKNNNNITLEVNKLHKLTFEIFDNNAYIQITTNSEVLIANATYPVGINSVYFTPTASHSFFNIKPSSISPSFSMDNASLKQVTSNTGVVTGATTTTSVYGNNAPILKRAVDVAKEGQADNIGDGSALFNGSTDHVVLGGSSPDSAFSISAWVFDTHASGSDFSAIYASNQTAIWFGVKNNSSGFVRLHINGDGNYADTPSGSFSSPSNEWIHLACTWDGTNAKIYINGVSQALSVTGTLANPTANANPEIGINDNNHSYNQWTGSISQVGIWRGALNQSQIQSVMESTSYSKIPADVKSTLGNNVISYNSVDNVNNTFVNNIATYTANGYIFFSGVAPVSTLFKLEYTVLTNTASGLRLAGGSSALGVVTLDDSVGTHSYNLVSSSNSNANYLSFNSTGFRGTITDISVKQISNEIVAYYGLDSLLGNKITPEETNQTLGSEIITNGDLSNGTTGFYDDNNSTFEVLNGELHAITSSTIFDGVRYNLGTNVESGKFYKIQFDYRVVGSSMFFYIFTDNTGTSSGADTDATATTTLDATSTTTATIYWKCTQTNARLSWVNGGSASREIFIDNVSVKEFGNNANHGVLK